MYDKIELWRKIWIERSSRVISRFISNWKIHLSNSKCSFIKMKSSYTASLNFCMFRHKKRNITFLVYVDNVCVVVKSFEHINWFKNEFKKIFKVKNLKKMKKILNIKITRDRKRWNYLIESNSLLERNVEWIVHEHRKARTHENFYERLQFIQINKIKWRAN